MSALPETLSFLHPTLKELPGALVAIDLPYTSVLLPAEKAELAQLEKHAHVATICPL